MARGPDDLHDDPDFGSLDALLAEARTGVAVPSAALMARVAEDARAVQHARAAPVGATARRGGVVAWLAGVFGGGGVLAGLATAALAGFWIGLAQPDGLSLVSEQLWPASEGDTVELIPTFEEVLSDVEG